MADTVIIPDFDRDHIEGQLSVEERRALYYAVGRVAPVAAFEVGTCRGGGSTYFIASALRNLMEEGRSMSLLHSSETHRPFFDHATALYQGALAYLAPFVDLHFGDGLEHFNTLPGIVGRNFAFIDGAEEAQPTLDQFNFFDEHFIRGSAIAFHDWQTLKTDLVRPILANHPTWKLWSCVDSLCIFRKAKA